MGVDDVSSSDTLAGEQPASEATVVVPDLAPTQAAELAWSAAEPDVAALAPERRPLPRSLLFLLGAVCAGLLMIAAFVIGQHQQQQNRRHAAAPPTSPSSAIATPSLAVPAPVLPATPPAPPTAEPPRYTGADARFLASIHADGVPYASGDDDAIVSAHQVCNWLADSRYTAHPKTVEDEIELTQTALGWTYQQSNDFVTDALKAYCPEQAR